MTRSVAWVKAAVILLSTGSVAATAAPLVWQLRGHDTIIPQVAVIVAQEPIVSVSIDLAPVLALAPFGATPRVVGVIADTSAPLDLTLLGVIVRDDPSRSIALIGSSTTEDNYNIGDEIDRNVKLKEVFSNYIVLSIDGESRKLSFDGAGFAEKENKIPTGEARLAAIMTFGQGTTISERNDAASRVIPVTTQDYIDLWRDRIKANPTEVLNAIGLVPTKNGYIIAEKHDSGVNRAGLKAGDIVSTVNGQPVGDIESDRALYDHVAESGMARIEVERNGRKIVMSFPLQ